MKNKKIKKTKIVKTPTLKFKQFDNKYKHKEQLIKLDKGPQKIDQNNRNG